MKRVFMILPFALPLIGCGGTEPQPTMLGAGDPLMGGSMPNGSLGSGATRGVAARKQPDLGVDATLNGFQIFDAKSAWNKEIDKAAVDSDSAKLLEKLGKDKTLVLGFGANKDGKPFGIPYTVVSGDAPRVAMNFASKDSDPGPYPFPTLMPIEPGTGGGHAIVIDRDGMKAYETADTVPDGVGFKASSGAIIDLRSDTPRKAGQIAADGSGLPILPGLVRYDEVNDAKEIKHALRFTLATVRKGYVAPATRSVGKETDEILLPVGTRLRLKKSFETKDYPASTLPILKALKKYGMILADTGADFALSGTPDMKWSDKDLQTLTQLKATDFEVLKLGEVKGVKDEAAAATPAASDTLAAPATKPDPGK